MGQVPKQLALGFNDNFCCLPYLSVATWKVGICHLEFYLLKKELCSENVLELSYKTVTGFKQHLNEIRYISVNCE